MKGRTHFSAATPGGGAECLRGPKLRILWAFRCCLLVAVVAASLGAPLASEEWLYIDNGTVRVGVKLTSGAGIGWFSLSSSNRNLINHWDHGRLVQQSYYGRPDESLWDQKPWRWNPVQGGDWRGAPAKILEVRSTTNTIYSKTLPKHWATGEDLTNTVMEQWITLTGTVAHVRFKFSYSGQTVHPEHDQEIPAVFMEPEFDTLVVYSGEKPWADEPLERSNPGWPNEGREISEHWAAYVNRDDFGMGVLVPAADRITCYRFGDGKREHGSCSYFAPLTRFAIKPGFIWEYDAYLTAGSIEKIRERFQRIVTGTDL